MKLSAALVTTLGFFLSTTEARDRTCYENKSNNASIIPSEAPDLIHRTTEFCRSIHGTVVKSLWPIKFTTDYPNGDGSGARFKITPRLWNGDKYARAVDGQLCTDLFADLIGTCPMVANPDTPHLFKGGAIWSKPKIVRPGGWVAQIILDPTGVF